MTEVYCEVMENVQGDEVMVSLTLGTHVVRRRITKAGLDRNPDLVKQTAGYLYERLMNGESDQ